MSININNDNNIPIDPDACYEELASQEELYLEETEEEVVAILTSYVSPASQSDRTTINNRYLRGARIRFGDRGGVDRLNVPRMVGNPDDQLVDAAEELITGNSDDPPLSEESIQEMLNDSPARGSDQ